MKNKRTLVVGILMLMSTTITAQESIQKAFNALRNNKNQMEVGSRHSLEKDPDTRKMIGLVDTYDFMITNPSARHLVEDIRQAFERDEPEAYNVSSGSHNDGESVASLAVGNNSNGGVIIGQLKGSKWIYACFLDPEDSLRQHRYAYALEWVEDDDKIRGRITKTYAIKQKTYLNRYSVRPLMLNNGDSISNWNGTYAQQGKSSEEWLTEFNTLKNLYLKNTNSIAASTYVTRIYRLCKNANMLGDEERNIVVSEILKLRENNNDKFILLLFDLSIENLKSKQSKP